MIVFVLSLMLAHDAPTGWTYDAFCCGGQDCAPVSDVIATDNGWMVEGELLPYDDPRILQSRDGAFHLCRGKAGTYCLYVPQPIT